MAALREKLGYALGDAASGGITWKIMSIAFPLFFTNVFGLSFADAAALMLLARMFDVVTDPLMGSIADRYPLRTHLRVALLHPRTRPCRQTHLGV